MGKRCGLIQIAQMIGLCDDLDLAILDCSQQFCLLFAILPIVFSIRNEDRAHERRSSISLPRFDRVGRRVAGQCAVIVLRGKMSKIQEVFFLLCQ
jgi:hypothetical protein